MSAREAIFDAATAHRLRCQLTTAQRHAIYERDGYRCRRCGVQCIDDVWSGDGWTADHIVPVVLGGTNDESNLQTLCRRCNSRKGWR